MISENIQMKKKRWHSANKHNKHEHHCIQKKGTHRQSRWFFICGPCPRILATRHVASVNLPLANCPYRRPVNGLELTKHCQLVSVLVFLQLILDIRCNSCRIFSSRVYIVTSTPKFPVTVFELEWFVLFVNHQTALPFQVSDKTGNRYFGRYLDQHVDVIRANLGLQDIDLFPLAKFSQHRSDFSSLFPIKDLSSKFRGKHDMIFAVPRCMCQRVIISIIHFKSFGFIVMQLADRISIVIKGFLFFRGLNARRLFWTHRPSRWFSVIQKRTVTFATVR